MRRLALAAAQAVVDLSGLFAAAFGGVYDDAVLYRRAPVDYDQGGKITAGESGEYPCKAQLERTTEAMRQAQDFSDTDQRIFVLTASLGVAPTTEDEIEVRGTRWGIASVDQDPARAYWELRGARRG